MNEIKDTKWYDLNEDEVRKFLTFIHSSLEKDTQFKALVKNVKAALNHRRLAIKLYIPELGMNVVCEGQDLLNAMNEMEREMPLANDTNNQRTKVSLGLPKGFMVTPNPENEVLESNVWFLELGQRACVRSLAKAFSTHDVVAVGLEVRYDSSIYVHVAYKDEVKDNRGLTCIPITASFLSRMMGVAA